MEINSTAQSASTGGGSSSKSLATLGQNFDNFLLLLTQQLKNQDPLSPLDTNEFTQQLVQFTGVEQAINTNRKLDQLIGLQTGNQTAMAVGYLGKTVEANSDRVGLVDGAATVTYELPRNATSAVILFTDASGKPVRIEHAEVAAGAHSYQWDGTDADGNDLPDGIYGVQVSAVDAAGQSIPVGTGTVGVVSGVEIVDGQVILNIGALGLPFGDIRQVRPS